MAFEELNDKQKAILDFLKSELLTKGYPPSVREMCSAIGVKSTSTVHSYLEALEDKGYIKRNPSKPRAIEIIDECANKKEMINVPIIGEVAAGHPILAEENIIDRFPVPSEYISSNNNLFMLSVKGESMIGCGIMDGDYVIVQQQATADNGDIVVALIDDGATIKRFYKEKDFIKLQPENPDMEPIIVNECKILGKAVGLFRKMK